MLLIKPGRDQKILPLLYKVSASKQIINQVKSLIGDIKNVKLNKDLTQKIMIKKEL